mmetsp:Transcript_36337/g.54230  ORF Transcript_36337/g.54230 Transcript_36337/m.54230 type:complete len:217 (+) Transcript_36337:612-1262(+)
MSHEANLPVVLDTEQRVMTLGIFVFPILHTHFIGGQKVGVGIGSQLAVSESVLVCTEPISKLRHLRSVVQQIVQRDLSSFSNCLLNLIEGWDQLKTGLVDVGIILEAINCNGDVVQDLLVRHSVECRVGWQVLVRREISGVSFVVDKGIYDLKGTGQTILLTTVLRRILRVRRRDDIQVLDLDNSVGTHGGEEVGRLLPVRIFQKNGLLVEGGLLG